MDTFYICTLSIFMCVLFFEISLKEIFTLLLSTFRVLFDCIHGVRNVRRKAAGGNRLSAP